MVVYVVMWREPDRRGWNLYGVYDSQEKAAEKVQELKKRDVEIYGREDIYKIRCSNLNY